MTEQFDVVVVGAGFAGLYAVHTLRRDGFTVRAFETGDGVGGTWYWNRYPGARCDVESIDYQYSFFPALIDEWRWSERYPAQAEILNYLNHLADRFDLRRDIQLETTVTATEWDETAGRWSVETDRGDHVIARYLILAGGSLSTAKEPEIAGVASFRGLRLHTCARPHVEPDLTGRRVAVIGTGSSAIQAMPGSAPARRSSASPPRSTTSPRWRWTTRPDARCTRSTTRWAACPCTARSTTCCSTRRSTAPWPSSSRRRSAAGSPMWPSRTS
jgi:cation diffusion facilitator CzcD-associated flavoprotein CzcO